MKNKEVQVIRFSRIKDELMKIVDCDDKNPETRIKATNLIHSLKNFMLFYYVVFIVAIVLFVKLYLYSFNFFMDGGTLSLSVFNGFSELKFTFFGKTDLIAFLFSLVIYVVVIVFYFIGMFYLKEKIINKFFNKIKPDQLTQACFMSIKEKSTVNLRSGLFVFDVLIGLFD